MKNLGPAQLGIVVVVILLFLPIIVLSGPTATAVSAPAPESAALGLPTPVALPTEQPTEPQAAPVHIRTGEILGAAELDLNLLSQRFGVGETDNIRWSLVRRTPQAAQIYQKETGVDWGRLRGISASGTILILAGTPWSFSETFKLGPGYKDASGIKAGGHCALATVFRAAVVNAGLPTHIDKQHRIAIPGFSTSESVSILWGRDDLVVSNTTDQHLFLVWKVTPDRANISVEEARLPPLPFWRGATIAAVYGHPGPGGWGSLGTTDYADHALHLSRTFAGRVNEWNGDKAVVVAVNPNVSTSAKITHREHYLHYLISEARRQGYYVMLDVKTGSRNPLTVFSTVMDRYLQENVWLNWDIESTAGGVVNAIQINEAASLYFGHRRERGFDAPGIFGFYVFSNKQVINPGQVVREYENGVVLPMFDGYGTAEKKIKNTQTVVSLYSDGPYGIMEFETRWGSKYDKIGARAYFDSFSDALIVASQ